jgi:hypothetical protein
MPLDDEIVARVPLVNFYALGALRKPNFLGGAESKTPAIEKTKFITNYRQSRIR